jgi:hypothetical protein
MQKIEYNILPNNILEKIEINLSPEKKLVYALAIDDLGDGITLIIEGYKFNKLSLPVYTAKFIVDSLSFFSLVQGCNNSLDEKYFEQIDALLNARHKFVLAFDTEGGVTSFKRSADQAYDFPPTVLSQSIAFGVFEGSCCYYHTLSNGQRVLTCVSGTTCPCPAGWICH